MQHEHIKPKVFAVCKEIDRSTHISCVFFQVIAFCDGQIAVSMPPAQDHKRLLEGNAGPNTGGMGAYAPCPQVGGYDSGVVLCIFCVLQSLLTLRCMSLSVPLTVYSWCAVYILQSSVIFDINVYELSVPVTMYSCCLFFFGGGGGGGGEKLW